MNPKERKREQILEAATTVFSQKGYAGALMMDIAREAGVAKGTLYEYFSSKEDLFFGVFQWLSGKTGMEIGIKLSAMGGSAAQRLSALAEGFIREWIDQLELYGLVLEFWAAASSERFRERLKTAFRDSYTEFREIVSSLLLDGIGRGEFRRDIDVHAVSSALIGTIDALVLQAWFDERFDPLSAAQGFATVLLHGLCKDPETKGAADL